MRILIAPNSFKNSLDAGSVAKAISLGLAQSKLSCTSVCFPVGDGGDGTASLLVQHFQGTAVQTTVTDPIGRKIQACFGLIDNGQTAVIELADASGLRLLQPTEYDPLHATTYGTGELVKKVLDLGVKKIIIGIGGSATVDAGIGIMQALGIQFYDDKEAVLEPLPASLVNLSRIDRSGLDKRLAATELVVLCDVANTLLGKEGAAAVFAPQKGASAQDVLQLEKAITRLSSIVLAETGRDMATLKYGGASGGVAAGLHSFFNATLVNGIDHFLDITGFDTALRDTDLVITGEGSIDVQTLQGKAPFGVAKRAKERSIPVIGIAGKVPLHADEQLQQYFDVLLPVSHEAMDLKTAMANTHDNLVRTAKMLGDLLSLNTS